MLAADERDARAGFRERTRDAARNARAAARHKRTRPSSIPSAKVFFSS